MSIQRMSTTVTFPQDVMQTAELAMLGNPEKAYKPELGKIMRGIFFGILLVGIWLLQLISGSWRFVWWWLLLPLPTAIAAFMIFRGVGKLQRGRFYLFQKGFVTHHQRHLEACSWPTITTTRRRGSAYEFRRADGLKIRLNNATQHYQELGEAILTAVTHAHYPQAIEAYHAGETLAFGALSINNTGIIDMHRFFFEEEDMQNVAYEENMQDAPRITWQQIHHIEIDRKFNQLAVHWKKEMGEEELSLFDEDDLINSHLLLALLGEILSTQNKDIIEESGR
ncbi:MAG: hypothetical protein J2P37_23290 [Ktedonobacteraceae bacterium]|nr:hypothetical protein [Ktedonobacteraceae bacterium]